MKKINASWQVAVICTAFFVAGFFDPWCWGFLCMVFTVFSIVGWLSSDKEKSGAKE